MVRLSDKERPDNAAVNEPTSGPLLWVIRLLLVILGLAAWFGTQHLIATRGFSGHIDDALLDALAPVNTYLQNHIPARNALLIASSLVIDVLGVFLLGSSILGKTIRPFLGLLMLFALRQLCQAICVLPIPDGMIWPKEGPGFPSLLVTYGVGNDLFFSGHTALAVYGAVELSRLRRAFIPLGLLIALFEILTVLSLRAHWTMDVYAGAVTAFLIAIVAGWTAPAIDRRLARLSH